MPYTVSDLPASVEILSKKEEWTDTQKALFVKTANAILEESDNEGIAIATGIERARGEKENADKYNDSLKTPESGKVEEPSGGSNISKTKAKIKTVQKEKLNAKQMPIILFVRHMNNGICGYAKERVLVSTETMKTMCKSFNGKPVYVAHQGVELETLQEDAAGYVTRCFYNELDGWLWAEILVVSDEGHEAVKKGWRISNAYLPTKWGSGGTCHDVEYNREIIDGEFTHLAIVPKPRYEDAEIFTPEEFKAYQDEKQSELAELQNSKEKRNRLMFWKKEEITSPDELQNAMVDLEDGSSISVGDMKEALENAKKNGTGGEADEEAKKEKINTDTEIEVGDEKMTLKELINRFQKMNTQKEDEEKANAEEEAKKVAEEKANAEEDEKIKEEEKANSKHFDELKNAKGTDSTKVNVDTSAAKVARGKTRYGSHKEK